MKKLIATYYLYLFVLFVFITLFEFGFSIFQADFEWYYLAFWAGGLIGVLAPDIDHLIYVYFLRPHELTSQRAARLISQNKPMAVLELLAKTREERGDLVFHNVPFQLVFVFFSFFVVSSSASLFGSGFVIAFLLHLAIDQIIDLMQLGNLNNWLTKTKINFTKEQATIYWVVNLLLLLLFSFYY